MWHYGFRNLEAFFTIQNQTKWINWKFGVTWVKTILTKSVEWYRLVRFVVPQEIDHFRSSHHAMWSLQKVILEPLLLMQPILLIDPPMFHLLDPIETHRKESNPIESLVKFERWELTAEVDDAAVDASASCLSCCKRIILESILSSESRGERGVANGVPVDICFCNWLSSVDTWVVCFCISATTAAAAAASLCFFASWW